MRHPDVQGIQESLNDAGSPVFCIRNISNQFFALHWTTKYSSSGSEGLIAFDC